MSLRLYAVNEKAERGIEAVVFWVGEGKLALWEGDGYANKIILSIIWSSSSGTIRHWVGKVLSLQCGARSNRFLAKVAG